MSPVGFVGLSHLGIVTGTGWASLGAHVVGFDQDAAQVAKLAEGTLPIFEPGLDALFKGARARMDLTTDPAALAKCRLVIVTRDVPTDDANTSDTSVVTTLIDAALPHLAQDVTLVVMSQVPPGFTRALRERIRAARPELRLQLYYLVETLIFGRAVDRCLHPERLIVGCEDAASPLPRELAEGLARFQCPILPMGYESAELTKTAINLYLCATVTYANTMSDLCEGVGATWSEMVPALRLDKRIGPAAYIVPSLGIAGGNLERDMVTLRDLARQKGIDGELLETLLSYNAKRRNWVQRKLEERLFAQIERPIVAVWGLAYKRDTRSTKNSMALSVIASLRGRAEIRAFDPLVTEAPAGAAISPDRDSALLGADCLLVLTDWPQFATIGKGALRTMRQPLVVDGVGIVSPAEAARDGARLVAMGRPSS